MPRTVRPPKITIGIRTRSNTLRSRIPIPSSNAVTTAQIVRTMKRGENGSSNVSMGPLKASCAVIILVARSLFQSCNNDVHDIWRTGHGYDNASRLRLPNSPPINQYVTLLGHLPGCHLIALQREVRKSVAVRAQLVGNAALLEAALRKPGIGTFDGARDVIGRARKIVR